MAGTPVGYYDNNPFLALMGSPPDQGNPAITAAGIQRGTGFAYNPETGQYEQAYAKAPGDSQEDWTNFSFDPTGRTSLAGWAPGYYSDNGSAFGDVGDFFGKAAAGTAGLQIGGASGASAATGNGITQRTVAADVAGLGAGAGAASLMAGAPAAAAPAAAGATGAEGTGAVAAAGGEFPMPPAILDTGGAAMMPAATPASAAELAEWGMTPAALPAEALTADGFPAAASTVDSFAGEGSAVTNGVSDLPMAPAPGTAGETFGLPPSSDNGFFGDVWDSMKKRPWGWMELGMGGLGLYNMNRMSNKLGENARAGDPFSSQRPFYQDKLKDMITDPTQISKIPGYEAGLDAVQRKMAAQGYLGSGNMMIGLQKYAGDFYNQYIDRLMKMSGVDYNSDAGKNLINGQNDFLNLQAQSLNRMMYGSRDIING